MSKKKLIRSLVDRVANRLTDSSDLVSRAGTKEQSLRKMEIEVLEPRILFSGSPAPEPAPEPAPAAQEAPAPAPAEDGDAPTESEATVAAPPAASDQSGAEEAPGGGDTAIALSESEVAAIAEAAAQRWIDSGASVDQSATLSQIDYQIADLADGRLASAEGNSITIDADAAGLGWFVDSTPGADEEFGSDGRALGADQGVDLLTAILHEQGHVLGVPETSSTLDLMYEFLGAGERRLPGDGSAASATDQSTSTEFLTALGTGTGNLVGNDLTDLGNNGVEGSYVGAGNTGGFDAVFFSSDEPFFNGSEGSFNVFDNLVGSGDAKSCCGTSFPQIVGADFSTTLATGDTQIHLTRFTLTSSNDSPQRDPQVWRIEGSNDTTTGLDGTWTTIYDHPTGGNVWTARNQVLSFSAADGDTFLTTEGFKAFRMVTDATGATSGAFYALNEIELFGYAAVADAIATDEDTPIGIQDNFDDNSIDATQWTVVTAGIPQNPKGVVEQNGQIELEGRAHFNTVDEFVPSAANPLTVSGTWEFVSGDDLMQILTRTDGVPAGSFGETANGIELIVNSIGTTDNIKFQGRGAAAVSGATTVTLPGGINGGDKFTFTLKDDGTNLSATLTQVGDPTNTATVSATSTYAPTTNLVSFHNRESGRRSNLDDVAIVHGSDSLLDNDIDVAGVVSFDSTSAAGAAVTVNPDGTYAYDPTASPTLQVLDTGEVFTDTFTYTVGEGMILRTYAGPNNLAALDAALAAGTIPTGQSLIDFADLQEDNNGSERFAVDNPFPGVGGNNYGAVVTGTLVVEEAGTYTFGTFSDDASRVTIDLDQDGDLSDETAVVTQAGCCHHEIGSAVTLAVGTYDFQAAFTEIGGGSYAEFYYTKGDFSSFNTSGSGAVNFDNATSNGANFVLVGDGSQGIAAYSALDTSVVSITVTGIDEVLDDAIATDEDTPIGIQDNFDDNSIDATQWSVVTAGIPQNPKGVVEQNGQIELEGRAHFNTVDEFVPSAANPLTVSGTWEFVSGDDLMQILTRTDGVPAGGFGETANGIELIVNSIGTTDNIKFQGRGAATVSGATTVTLPGGINGGDKFTFILKDDGTNLSATLTQVGDPTNTATVSATSTYAPTTNLVSFHNRESGRRSNLDDVAISQGDLLANDPGAVGDVLGSDATSAEGAAVAVNANGSYTYDPTVSATLNALGTGDVLTDTFTYTVAPYADGKIRTVGIDISGGGESNDSQISNLTEAENIYAAAVAAGFNFSAGQTGNVTSGGSIYNITSSGEELDDRVDYGGANRDFTPNENYPGVTSGEDFLLHSEWTMLLQAGTYTIYGDGDDGFSLKLGGVTFDNKFGAGAAQGAANEIRFENPTGSADTGGTFTLAQDTVVNAEMTWFERGGGDFFELAIQTGATTSGTPGAYQIVADGVLGMVIGSDESQFETATVNVAVTGVNDAPTANDDTNTITETGGTDAGETATTTGNVLGGPGVSGGDVADSDPDTSDDPTTGGSVEVIDIRYTGTANPYQTDNAGGAVNVGTLVDGRFGTLTINPDGGYSYALDDAAVDALQGGEAPVDEFTYTIADGSRYVQNFNAFADGTTNLGDGTTISSQGSTASVQGGALMLADNAANENSVSNGRGIFRIPALANSSLGWTASFDAALDDTGDTNDPADGFSFSYGNIPAPNAVGGENGWGGGVDHLAFSFNVNTNDGRYGVFVDGASVATSDQLILPAGGTRDLAVTVSYDPENGATLTVDGVDIFTNLDVGPGFVPVDAYTFAIASRTGGRDFGLKIDNLEIVSAGASDTATLAITVNGTNDLPVANNDPTVVPATYVTTEEAVLTIAGPTALNFDDAGTGATLQQDNVGASPAVFPGGPTGSFLRLIHDDQNNSNNGIAFDRTAVGPFSQVKAEFDYRAGGTGASADGFSFLLLPTADWGTSGAGPDVATEVVAEEPNLPGTFAVGFDFHPAATTNTISLHFDGTQREEINLPLEVIDLEDGAFHRVSVTVDPVAGGGSNVSVSLVPDFHGTPGAPIAVFTDVFISDLDPYEGRAMFAGRTGGLNMSVDLDNISVFTNGLLANDSDVDNAIAVLPPVGTTDGGATVTVDADGGFTYDPNGQFEFLGTGETAQDTFTYGVIELEYGDFGTVVLAPTGAGGTYNAYARNSTFQTWDEARVDALSTIFNGVSGHLVTISSAAENSVVQGLAVQDSWIGLTDSTATSTIDGTDLSSLGTTEAGNTSGQPLPGAGTAPVSGQRGFGFQWVTGEAFTYQNWAGGEPNDSGSEDVAHIRANGQWNDQNGGTTIAESDIDLPSVIEFELGLADLSSLGFPGFATTTYTGVAGGSVANLAAVDAFLAGSPSGYDAFVDTVNMFHSGGDGKFAAGNQPTPGVLPGDQNNYIVEIATKVLIPKAGIYTFGVNSGDGFGLKITGSALLSEHGNTNGGSILGPDGRLAFSDVRGSADTLGQFSFDAPGFYDVELIYWENGGGSQVELFAAQGAFTAFNSTSFQLVGAEGGLYATPFTPVADATAVATVTVTGINDAPTANDDMNTITETGGADAGESATTAGNVLGGTGVSGGDVADSDPDTSDDPTAANGSVAVIDIRYTGAGTPFQNDNAGGAVDGATLVDGQFGTLTINPDGSYIYALDDAAVDALQDGDTPVEQFTYTLADGTRYVQSFDGFADGTTILGDGSSLETSVANAGVDGGALRLTQDAAAGGQSTFRLPALAGTSAGWTASFDVTVGDPDNGIPADGFSFSWGDLGATGFGGGAAEEGFGTTTDHIAFEFDSYVPGDAERGYNISVNSGGNGADPAFVNENVINQGQTRTFKATLSWDPVAGATMVVDTGVNGNVVTLTASKAQLDALGFNPNDSYTFAFRARTGGLNQDVLIDNLEVVSVGVPDTATLEITVNGKNDGPIANADTYATTEDAMVLASGSSGTISATQDFDGAGTAFTIQNDQSGSAPSEIAGPNGDFLRLIYDGQNNNRNAIAFDKVGAGAFESVDAQFDFRANSPDQPADGFSFILLPTATYGDSGAGPDATSFAGENPNLADTFGIGFDFHPGATNAIRLHFDGTQRAEVNVPVGLLELDSGLFHRVSVQVDPVSGGGSLVSVSIIPDINGTPGAPVDIFIDFFIAGLDPYEFRTMFAGRTGGANMNIDLDNISSVPLGVLANDIDVDSAITVVDFDTTSASGAAVDVSPDGSFTYDPTAAPLIQQLDAGDTLVDTFTYTASDADGKIRTVGIDISGGGGSNDDQLDSLVEAEALYQAAVAAGFDFANGQTGTVTVGPAIYNVTLTAEELNDRTDWGGSGRDFSPTENFPGNMTGDDFLIHSEWSMLLKAGTYTVYGEGDDGFSLKLSGVTFDNKFGDGAGEGGTNEIRRDALTANTNTGGTFTLAENTIVNADLTWFERGGGEFFELTIQSGATTNQAPDGSYTPIADGVLGMVIGSDPSQFATATATVNLTGLNDAPTVVGTEDFNDVAISDFDNDGDTVAYLLNGGAADVDDDTPDATVGIAVTSTNGAPGSFEYQLDGTMTWVGFTATDTSSWLLRPEDRVRFVPDGSTTAGGSIDFRAWDRTGGAAAGTTADTTSNGGTTRFSGGVASNASVTVANVVIDTGAGTGGGTLIYGATSGEENHLIVEVDANGDLVITDLNGNDISGQGNGPGSSTVTVSGAFEDIVIGAGDENDTVTVGDMGSFSGSLTILGESGFDEVVIANGTELALGTGVSDGGADESLLVESERFTADLDSSVSVVGDGTIDILAAGGSGDFAGLNLRRASLSSEGGGITLTGVGGDTGNTNDGVVLTHGSTVSTGGGGVTITGTATSTTGANDGISLKGGSDITAGGAGGITLTGTSSGVNSSYGVQLFSGTEVTTMGGDIAITGASDAVGSRNAGIYANGATVTAGGAGSVAMTGTGGGAGSNNNGLSLAATAVDAGTSGDVTLVGMGGGGTSGNGGVQVGTRTSVSAGGGDVTITGTGGAGTGVRNTGVSLLSGSSVSSGADTEITGVAGTGTSRNGGVVLTSATVAAAGDLTVDGTGNGTGSYNSGISSSRSTLGGAEVTLAGTGSTSSTAGRFNDGVSISRGGVTATGTLTIDAAGGTGSRDNRGLMVNRAALGGTLALTGSADTDSGSRSTGVFIQNSVLSDDGTIEGTGGGVGGADGLGVYMRNITGGNALGVTTTPDTDEEKGGNYFDAVLPAMLVLGAGAGAGNRGKRNGLLSGLISRLPQADTTEGEVEVYLEEDGHVGLTPLVVTGEALLESGVKIPASPEGLRRVLLLTGGEFDGLGGLFASLDAAGNLVCTEGLEEVSGLTVGGLLELLESGAPRWSEPARQTVPKMGAPGGTLGFEF